MCTLNLHRNLSSLLVLRDKLVAYSDSLSATEENSKTKAFMAVGHDVEYSSSHFTLNSWSDEVSEPATCSHTAQSWECQAVA